VVIGYDFVEFGIQPCSPKCEVKQLSLGHIAYPGFGMHAKVDSDGFFPGEEIGHYAGYFLPARATPHNRFILAIDEEYYIDAYAGGNETRFINDHRNVRATPNAEFGPLIHVEGAPPHVMTCCVHAIERIMPGDEILVSYGAAYWKAIEAMQDAALKHGHVMEVEMNHVRHPEIDNAIYQDSMYEVVFLRKHEEDNTVDVSLFGEEVRVPRHALHAVTYNPYHRNTCFAVGDVVQAQWVAKDDKDGAPGWWPATIVSRAENGEDFEVRYHYDFVIQELFAGRVRAPVILFEQPAHIMIMPDDKFRPKSPPKLVRSKAAAVMQKPQRRLQKKKKRVVEVVIEEEEERVKVDVTLLENQTAVIAFVAELHCLTPDDVTSGNCDKVKALYSQLAECSYPFINMKTISTSHAFFNRLRYAMGMTKHKNQRPYPSKHYPPDSDMRICHDNIIAYLQSDELPRGVSRSLMTLFRNEQDEPPKKKKARRRTKAITTAKQLVLWVAQKLGLTFAAMNLIDTSNNQYVLRIASVLKDCTLPFLYPTTQYRIQKILRRVVPEDIEITERQEMMLYIMSENPEGVSEALKDLVMKE
jgi:hypothetical protein